jgi:hypothetical protein
MKGNGAGKEGKQFFSFTRVFLLIPIIFVAGLILISSCTKKYEFTMGQDFFDSQTRLQVIDTFSVNVSTVLIDSLKTSATKIALAGNYRDDIFGSVNVKAFFDLGYQDFEEIEEKATYDSAAFSLKYTGYSYGDTTSLLKLDIHMLAEKIEPYSGYLYNTSSFDYSPEVTGSVSFYPAPESADTAVYVPVNALGEDLFNKIRDNDENLSNSELFSDYLKGFVITSGSPDNKSVIGFTADKENLKLIIYYHLDAEEPEKKEITLSMGQENHQFNSVKFDHTNTPLNDIEAEGNVIPSSRTNNYGFLQGMVGLIPKLQFPSLNEILAIRRWKILKAELVIEPVYNSYDMFGLPKQLYIYDTDRENRVNTILLDDLGNPLTATLKYDDIYEEEVRYTYDITKFINDELSDAYFDYNHGLMPGLAEDNFTSSLERLLIECKNPPVKLRIYFLTY